HSAISPTVHSTTATCGLYAGVHSHTITTAVFQVVIIDSAAPATWGLINRHLAKTVADINTEAEVVHCVDAELAYLRGNRLALYLDTFLEEVLKSETNAAALLIKLFAHTEAIHSEVALIPP